MSEYSHEPVRGIPGDLPADEHILWQASPNWVSHAKAALHIRITALYFVAIIVWALINGDGITAVGAAMLGVIAVGLFVLYAWGVGRTTVYTLTNKRVILHIGVALNTCINIPLSKIESANLKMLNNGHGNIVLQLTGMPHLGYTLLWPHARSMRFIRPQPMMRAVPDAITLASQLFNAAQQVQAIMVKPARIAERIAKPAFIGATA